MQDVFISYRVKEPGFRGRFGDCNCSTGGPEVGDVPQVRLCQSHRQCSYTTNLTLAYSPSYQILHPFPRSLTCPIVSGHLSAFATTSWLDHCLVTPEANKQLQSPPSSLLLPSSPSASASTHDSTLYDVRELKTLASLWPWCVRGFPYTIPSIVALTCRQLCSIGLTICIGIRTYSTHIHLDPLPARD